MASLRSSQRMGDFVHQCVENFFSRIMASVVFSDLDSTRTILADSLATLRLCPRERPCCQAVLQQLLLCNSFDLMQIHTPVPGSFLNIFAA
jgi:hypothetical protein